MLCEKCKEREATVRFTEIINGKVTEHNLCMECARSNAWGGQNYAAFLNGENPLGRLLSGLLSMAGGIRGDEDSPLGEQVSCPVCHTSYGEFVKQSRFGCGDCYEVFELLMEDHIKNLQGSTSHRGKRPMKKRSEALQEPGLIQEEAVVAEEAVVDSQEAEQAERMEQIEACKQRLQVALLEEEYEEAARLRDEIRALQKLLEAEGGLADE